MEAGEIPPKTLTVWPMVWASASGRLVSPKFRETSRGSPRAGPHGSSLAFTGTIGKPAEALEPILARLGPAPRSMAFGVLDKADMQGRFCASLNRRRETMSVSEMALVGASCAWLAVASQQLPKVRNTSAAKSLTCEHGVLGLQALLVPSLRR